MSGPARPEPARGVLAGIKADLARAKEAGKAYDPRGHGNAFTHDFLNKKPWHPMNFKNQIRKYEAEQRLAAEQKAKEQAQAEFETEQERQRALSYLSDKEQQRLSMAWMYTKPPGLEAAMAKEEATKAKEFAASSGAVTAPGSQQGQALAGATSGTQQQQEQQQRLQQQQHKQTAAHAVQLDRMREDPVAAMLTARVNLRNNQRFIVKHAEGAFGGFSSSSANQQLLDEIPGMAMHAAPLGPWDPGQGMPRGASTSLRQQEPCVVADAEDLAVLATMSSEERAAVLKRLHKLQRRAERKQQMEQAQAVLRAAGFDLESLQAQGEKRATGRRKKHRKKSGKEDSKRRDNSQGKAAYSSDSESSRSSSPTG